MSTVSAAHRNRKIKAIYRRWLEDEKFFDEIADGREFSDTTEVLRNLGGAIAYAQAMVNKKCQSPSQANETRGGAGDDCSVGKRGVWPHHDGQVSALRSNVEPELDVTAGETAIKSLSPDAQWALTELHRKEVMTGCTSYVQRKLQIGFNKACRILEELEQTGWITASDNSGARSWLRRSAALTPHQRPSPAQEHK